MKGNKTALVIWLLVLVILILAIIMLYVFLVQPAIIEKRVQAQSQGYEFAIVSVMQAAAQCQQVPLTYNNVTINLIAVECLQQG